MSYPNDLKEYPQLEGSTYPFRLFFNECRHAKIGQNILFLHWHEHFEIIIMQAGSAIFHIDSKPYELHPGEVLFVPSEVCTLDIVCGMIMSDLYPSYFIVLYLKIGSKILNMSSS